MPRGWIDFRELRAKLRFEDVFNRYNIAINRKGEQHTGPCPLPSHPKDSEAECFSANLSRGIFHCFDPRCGAKGNTFEFCALMEGVALKNGQALRRLALDLQKSACPSVDVTPAVKQSRVAPMQLSMNSPLDFELKGLDARHPFFREHGLSPETVSFFGLGFCSKGSFKNRIVAPLHNEDRQLVGYAGRVVDEAAESADNPRYRYPERRERKGSMVEFVKEMVLYNGSRLRGKVQNLVITAEPEAVWWLHENDLRHAVATFHEDMSELQVAHLRTLVDPKCRMHVIANCGDSGIRFAKSVFAAVGAEFDVRWVKLPPNVQPSELSPEQLADCFPA